MCILMGVAGCRKKKPALKWSFKENYIAGDADNESNEDNEKQLL